MSQGSIIKREGARGVSWLLKYDLGRDPLTGKRQQRYKTIQGNKKDAERELRKLLGQVDEGTHVDPARSTVAEWLETWIRDYAAPSVAGKTFERYRELLRLHVIPNIGHVPAQKLAAPHIQGLYAKLRKEGKRVPGTENERVGLSERTILHVHRVLSQALSEGVRSRVISRNPADDVKAPRPGAAKSSSESGDDISDEVKALAKEQVTTLLMGFKGNALFEIVSTAVATGMRRGELLALRWCDVDLDQMTIRVARSLENTKEGGLKFKPPKNKSSRRTIGIDRGLAEILRGHWKRMEKDMLKVDMVLVPHHLVFPKSVLSPVTPQNPTWLYVRFVRRMAEIGLKGYCFHHLRHTHATLLLTAKPPVPVNAVSQRLGHSNAAITLNVYGHVLKRAEDHAVAVAGSLLEGALTQNAMLS